MKILSYNINNGCKGKEGKLFNWITARNADIVGLNELNGWTQTKLNEYAFKSGYRDSQLTQNKSGYRIGIISKDKITKSEMFYDKFHHALLYVLIKDVNVFITHLTPKSSKKRELEVEEIIRIINERTNPSIDKIILMGDFNNLSPSDERFYSYDALDNEFRANPKRYNQLVEKFFDQNKINYSPIASLLEFGFKDLVDSDELNFTVPTEKDENDPMHAALMRLDYILVKNITSDNISIIKDATTNSLSDHYPVELKIEDNFQINNH